MRTEREIRKEINKVRDARKQALHKVDRCNDRLDELDIELNESVLKGRQA